MGEIYEAECQQPTTRRGHLCERKVAIGSTHCGFHQIPPSRWAGYSQVSPAAQFDAAAPFSLEDLVADPVRLEAVAPEIPRAQPATITEIDVAKWARAGATNPDVVRALRDDYGLTPEEAAMRVRLANGESVTFIAAVERGEIAAYDAPLAAATYPGEGWEFDADHWTLTASPEFLADLARQYGGDAPRFGVDNTELGAQMAAELDQLGAAELGGDLRILRGEDPPTGWAANLPEGVFREAARRAIGKVSSGDVQYAAFRRGWLENTPTPSPTSAAM